MPFTPFHLGPAAIIKVLIPGYFSLSLFTLVQIVIDTEPLYYMLTDNPPLHRVLHSYVGATFVALACLLIGKPICRLWIKFWNHRFVPGAHSRLYVDDTISWWSAICGVFFGAYSHVFLDSIMHAEIQPFMPYLEGNSLYGVMSLLGMHMLLIMMGTIGLFWLLISALLNRYKN